MILSVALFYISKLQQILSVLTTIEDTVDSIKVPIKKITNMNLNDLTALANQYGSYEKIKTLLDKNGINISKLIGNV